MEFFFFLLYNQENSRENFTYMYNKKEAMPSISVFLLRIALPALTIGLILENQTTFQTMTQYGKMVLSQILMYFVMAAGGILGSHICHLKGTTANVHCGCSVGGNYGFYIIYKWNWTEREALEKDHYESKLVFIFLFRT